MRIISNFTDYYDATGLAFGIDNRLVYTRKTEEVSIHLLDSHQKSKLADYLDDLPCRNSWRGTYKVRESIIGFCGKLYPLWILYGYGGDPKPFYTVAQLEDYSKGYFEIGDEFYRKRSRWGYYNRTHFDNLSLTHTLETLSGTPAEDIFFSLNTPCFRYYETEDRTIKLISNPNLRELKFTYFFEPLEAFQEVSMFVGSLQSANENREYSVGGDKVVAASKGFDKRSFTQVAPTKKDKRRLNKERKQGD